MVKKGKLEFLTVQKEYSARIRQVRKNLLFKNYIHYPLDLIENCEIPFNVLLFLIRDRIKRIEQIWSGKLPSKPDLFCQVFKDFCIDCRNTFFGEGVCYNNLRDPLDGKSYNAKNMGWEIFCKTNITNELLPDQSGIKERFYYELLKDYHYTILAVTKRCFPIAVEITANYKKRARRLKVAKKKQDVEPREINYTPERMNHPEIELIQTPLQEIPNPLEATATINMEPYQV